MSLLQESVDALTAAAGWKKASPGADGVFRFRLEGDLDMEFFSPDGRTGILRADLGPLPAAEQDADDLLRKCASRMVAASRSRRTVLSVDEGQVFAAPCCAFGRERCLHAGVCQGFFE